MPETQFDIVVVGGGTAGCVLAARLSENPDISVLLLEAGSAEGPAEIHIVPAWPALLGGSADWSFFTAPQAGLGGNPVFYPRGKVLGGSSAINAMAHIRGHRSDYEAWTAGGADGWGYDDLLPYFKKSETAASGDPRYRGTSGPMRVGTAQVKHPVATTGLAAVAELGYPLIDDFNGESADGGGWLEMNVFEGQRQTAFDAYLKGVHRANLTIVSEALVTSLTIISGRCSGVTYVAAGQVQRVDAGEVVLAAGAIATPQLLMLSGVGPAAELEALGIKVVLDVPGVGKNLSDHPLAAVVYSAADELPAGVNNHADAAALLRTRSDLNRPDMMTLFMDIPFYPPTLAGPAAGYSIGFALMQPTSRGSVTLASADPSAAPVIDPALLATKEDMDSMIAALRVVRALGGAHAFASLRRKEELPGLAETSDDALRSYLQKDTGTYFHPVGTCRLGSDADAVVDLTLKFNGLDGLRIADASVMPAVVSANTNATVLAIAERAAEWIAG
jgi:choline dehydrogenase